MAALGASFAQVLCATEPSLRRRLAEAAARNRRLLNDHGAGLAADMLDAFLRALHDRDLFPDEAGDRRDPAEAGRKRFRAD